MLGLHPAAYQDLFPTKADMVRQVVNFDMETQKQEEQELLQQAANPVEEIILLLRNGIKKMSSINPHYISDLQQYYPEAWQLCEEYLQSYSYYQNMDIINKGILQGYFRKDINLQLVAKILLEQFNMMINPAIFPPERYGLGEVFRSIYLYYVRGICTERGGKMAEEYFSRNNL